MHGEDNKNNDLKAFRRHDFIVALILFGMSLFVFLESLRLTFKIELPGVETKAWLIAPGLLPLFLSGGLMLMSLALIFKCLREGEFKGHFTKMAFLKAISDRETLSKIIQMLLLCIYVFGLLGRLHFGLASALYLFAAMFVARAAKLIHILIIAIVFSGLITVLFGTVMKIPLP